MDAGGLWRIDDEEAWMAELSADEEGSEEGGREGGEEGGGAAGGGILVSMRSHDAPFPIEEHGCDSVQWEARCVTSGAFQAWDEWDEDEELCEEQREEVVAVVEVTDEAEASRLEYADVTAAGEETEAAAAVAAAAHLVEESDARGSESFEPPSLRQRTLDGFIAQPKAAAAAGTLPEGWASAAAPDGEIYYYRRGTHETQWHFPVDDEPPTRAGERGSRLPERGSRWTPASAAAVGAAASGSEHDVQALLDMGFEPSVAKAVLRRCAGDVVAAVAMLLC